MLAIIGQFFSALVASGFSTQSSIFALYLIFFFLGGGGGGGGGGGFGFSGVEH